jgi:hypothetical protein
MSAQRQNDPEVPAGVDTVGDWQMTPHGSGRLLGWAPIYENDVVDRGDDQPNVVRITAMQAATGHLGMFGVAIDVVGILAADEAALVAAAIRDALDRIEQWEQAQSGD